MTRRGPARCRTRGTRRRVIRQGRRAVPQQAGCSWRAGGPSTAQGTGVHPTAAHPPDGKKKPTQATAVVSSGDATESASREKDFIDLDDAMGPGQGRAFSPASIRQLRSQKTGSLPDMLHGCSWSSENMPTLPSSAKGHQTGRGGSPEPEEPDLSA